MFDNEYKRKVICPNCGQWNYKPPTYYKQKVLDDYGIEHYATISIIKYKCIACKCIWSEVWNENDT